jgi:hypothetical protein
MILIYVYIQTYYLFALVALCELIEWLRLSPNTILKKCTSSRIGQSAQNTISVNFIQIDEGFSLCPIYLY